MYSNGCMGGNLRSQNQQGGQDSAIHVPFHSYNTCAQEEQRLRGEGSGDRGRHSRAKGGIPITWPSPLSRSSRRHHHGQPHRLLPPPSDVPPLPQSLPPIPPRRSGDEGRRAGEDAARRRPLRARGSDRVPPSRGLPPPSGALPGLPAVPVLRLGQVGQLRVHALLLRHQLLYPWQALWYLRLHAQVVQLQLLQLREFNETTRKHLIFKHSW